MRGCDEERIIPFIVLNLFVRSFNLSPEERVSIWQGYGDSGNARV